MGNPPNSSREADTSPRATRPFFPCADGLLQTPEFARGFGVRKLVTRRTEGEGNVRQSGFRVAGAPTGPGKLGAPCCRRAVLLVLVQGFAAQLLRPRTIDCLRDPAVYFGFRRYRFRDAL